MPTSNTPYILYAEDNSSDAAFFQRAFRQAGGELPIVHFENGTGTLEFLENAVRHRKLLPRLLILDIKMPGMSGLELLMLIRQREEFSNLPVIILSASYEAKDVKLAYRHRVNAYIVKPNQYKELKSLTASIATFWGKYNKIPLS